jgi:hypothetical protein
MKKPWTVGNYISECPQKDWIKPYFFIDSNGLRQLAFKAGSKFLRPNGLDASNNPQYETYIPSNDIKTNTSAATDQTYFITTGSVSNSIYPWNTKILCLGSAYDNSGSQTTIVWWDTTNNLVRYSADSGSTFSIADSTITVGMAHWKAGYGYTDFVPFTFCGCMGNGFFTLPQTTVVGNGFNADNTPNNVTTTYSDIKWFVCTINYDENMTGIGVISPSSLYTLRYNVNYFMKDDMPAISNGSLWYQPKRNQMYRCANSAWGENTDWMALAYFSWDNTNKRITEFKPTTTIPELAKYY